MTHELAEPVRNILLENSKADGSCGILLSSGVDSNSILASLLRNGIKPTVYSFRVAGHYSTDFRYAARTAKRLNLDFVEVEILHDLDSIIRDVRWAIHYLGFRKKADIECTIPVKHIIDKAREVGTENLFSGAFGDHYFGTTRKCHVTAYTGNNLDDPTWLNKYREESLADLTMSQTHRLGRYAKPFGITVHAPYDSPPLVKVFHNSSWRSINKPKQKLPVRDAFPEMEIWGVGKKNQPLQLGDSRIAKTYEQLLTSDLNTGNWKSVVGIYNSIAKEKTNA